MLFHAYGFIIGCAIILGSFVITKAAKEHSFPEKLLDSLILTTIVSGILGARVWHIVTDFHIYQSNYFAMLQVWNGGLSIIGAFFGGALGLFIWAKIKAIPPAQLISFLDLIPFGLPLAQAVGRLGNFVNHELYGLPTNLPWKLYIPPEYRQSGFENFEYYHPLFAYEAVLLLILSGYFWWGSKKKNSGVRVGTGRVIAIYVLYYSAIRFGLDFLRIDTAMKFGGILGINQIVLLVLIILSVIFLVRKPQETTRT